MAVSNSKGELPTALKVAPIGSCAQMDAFDRLPKPIRDVIREAPIDYHCGQLHQLIAAFRSHGLSYDAIADIMVAEIPRHVQANVLAGWGPSHPQARISL